MGRNLYFCDYCNKAFNDDRKAREMHLKSSRHLQLKEEHYRQFKDVSILLREEIDKEPCMKFQRDGNCRWGLSCRYSHYTHQDIEIMKRQLRTPAEEQTIPVLSEWCRKKSEEKKMNKGAAMMSHQISSDIDIQSLPPSLRPFSVEEFLKADLSMWGCKTDEKLPIF